jgi:hypothetical protein
VAVIIDEYDKPLTDTLTDPGLNNQIRERLQGFYGCLKASDQWLRFVFLTGVTKFSKVSIFSTLNQLKDISQEAAFEGICGITESELEEYFAPEVRAMAEEREISYEQTLAEMKKRYDGYHFSSGNKAGLSEGVYNPFSLLNTLASKDFAYYWFRTGTPTFLVKKLREIDFDLRKLDGDITISPQDIDDYRPENPDPMPLLYQTGYLTIRGYSERYGDYTLGFPNEEVKYGFLKELIPAYAPTPLDPHGMFVKNFVRDLDTGDLEGFMGRLKAFFAGIPYELSDETERHYQVLLYVVFTLMGEWVQAEVHSSAGRADMVVEAENAVYCFEFKLTGSGTAEDALAQIDDKGYLAPYTASGRRLVKVGAVFDKKTRNIGEWNMQQGGDDA